MSSILAEILKRARTTAFRLSNTSESTAVTAASAALVVVSAWRHYGTSISPEPLQQEIWIEWLSWGLLYAMARVINSGDAAFEPLSATFWSSKPALWITAVVAVGSQIISNFQIPAWTIPIVTIAIVTYEMFTAWSAPESVEIERKTSVIEGSPALANPIGSRSYNTAVSYKTQFILIALSTLCAALLVYFHTYMGVEQGMVYGVLFIATRLTTLICLSKISTHGATERSYMQGNTLHLIERIAIPCLSILTFLLVIVRPNLEISSAEALGHAIMQSIWWTALMSLVNIGYASTSTNAETIGLAAQYALSAHTPKDLVAALASGYAASVHHIMSAKTSMTARKAIHVVFVMIVIISVISRDPRASVEHVKEHVKSKYLTKGHPIERTVADARKNFQAMEARQSKTLHQAEAEYLRRYGREPPPGFDKWFTISQWHDFVLVDEFDTFMNSIQPFYGVNHEILRQRAEMLPTSSINDKLSFVIMTDGKLQIDGDYPHAICNEELMEMIPGNISIALNSWDEPAVVSSVGIVAEAVRVAKERPKLKPFTDRPHYPEGNDFFITTSQQSGWHSSSHACAATSPGRQGTCPIVNINSTLTFITNQTQAMDVCQNCHIRDDHGLMIKPGSYSVSHELVPLWSASKPAHFNDILFPSPYYIHARGYDEKADPSWADKADRFYWTGSSTGGHNTGSWRRLHRQHLVLATNDPEHPVRLLKKVGSRYVPRISTMSEILDTFHTRIPRVLQCEPEACEEMEEAFGHAEQEPGEAAYENKYVIDIDGNGFSGRYYRLLGSKSAVVKSTILQEWHDDRLLPWVHYIPLSTSYDELPEMARFLTQEGSKYGEVIAKESQEWSRKALRDIDLQLVFVRMCLEWARLMNGES